MEYSCTVWDPSFRNKIKAIKEGQKIPEGQSNSLIENKLTTPWLKIKRQTDK